MKFPKKLEDCKTIGILAPSSPISGERELACIKAIKEMGFNVKVSTNLSKNYGGYMAGTGKERGQLINEMFADPEVDAIICIRGGDTGIRALEYIDTEIVKNNPKIFMGYSDITNFHLLFNQKCDLVTFHGPMVSSNIVDGMDKFTEKSMYACLNADKLYSYEEPDGFEIYALPGHEGKAEGVMIGGNLSLIEANVGTFNTMDVKDKIIFIEDVGEQMYRLDRMMWQMRNAGFFDQCAGVVLGQFTDCPNDYMPSYDLVNMMKDVFDGYDIPVLMNVQAGHGDICMTLPFGANCRFDTEKHILEFDVER
ncbi:MAG: LD-carboxypeptidase [Clostridia bacterium]|nr:LD-carboxypeptidase [Clostridia bacterium]